MLTAQRKGACLSEADDALRQLVKKCVDTGKKGKLTVTFEVRPTADTVTIVDDVATKAPKPEQMGSSFFADDEGNLSKNNPRQVEMFDDEKVAQLPKAANQ